MKEIKPKKLIKANLMGKDWESRLWDSIPCSPTGQSSHFKQESHFSGLEDEGLGINGFPRSLPREVFNDSKRCLKK